MKYVSLYDGYDFIHEENLLQTLLSNRGVKDSNRLLNLTSAEVHDGMLFKNMGQGLTLLNKHLKKDSKMHIIVDSDVDGLTSAGIMYQYIKNLNKNAKITYSLPKEKEHGIHLDDLGGYEYDLLIVPDAGTNDVDECRELYEKNIDVLILDHHEIDTENKFATIINCKDGQYPNPNLSGAGVVCKFCREYDREHGLKHSRKYLDLVALGTIADMSDLRSYETRYLTLQGMNIFGKHNKFLQEVMLEMEYSLQGKVTIKGIGWHVAPLLNAVIRIGDKKDKVDVFRALIGENETVEYKPRGKTTIEVQTLQQAMVKRCKSLKSKQDRLVAKGVEELNKKIVAEELDKGKIIMVDCTDILEKTFTGLVANKIASQYKRPTVLLRRRKDSEWYGGSCRNYSLSPIPNLKSFLESLEVFEYLGGHSNAMGFKIHQDNTSLVLDRAEKKLRDVKFEDVYKVDYEIPVGRLKNKHVKQVGKWQDLWGSGLNEPYFAITNIYISTDKIKLIGSRKNLIKFEVNNITFVKKFASEKVHGKMILRKTRGLNKKSVKRVKMNVVGKFTINEWEGNEYPQIEIVDFHVEEDNEVLF